jgi:hypothetical protein
MMHVATRQHVSTCMYSVESNKIGQNMQLVAGNGLDCWSKTKRPCPASGAIQSELQALADWGKTNAKEVKVQTTFWRSDNAR